MGVRPSRTTAAVTSHGVIRGSREQLNAVVAAGKKQWTYPNLMIGLVAVASTLLIFNYGWISDDAYITARYADNLVHGHGPVFNVGERVQGFTHPLWFLLFSGGLFILGEPIVVAVGLGGLLNVATFVVLGRALLRSNDAPAVAVVFLALFAMLHLSESWRSFQTSGLENSLTNFLLALVAVEVVHRETSGLSIFKLSLYSSLLVLTRPDLLLIVAPLDCLLVFLAWKQNQWRELAAGFSPVAVWLVFAQLFYGTAIPNTVTDKVGIYSTSEGFEQGIRYLKDFAYYEPATVFACVAMVAFVILTRPAIQVSLILVGLALYLVALTFVGGDFMRGRMFTPVVFAIAALAVLHAARSFRFGPRLDGTATFAFSLVVVFVGLTLLTPAQDAAIKDGIVNERLYYKDQSFRHYLRTGSAVQMHSGIAIVEDLRRLSDACGPLTVGSAQIGSFGYLLGPRFDVIDYLGLTDRYIADLPKSSFVGPQRPGHPTRWIPLSYLAGRGDITLFSNWRDFVASADCRLTSALQSLPDSDAVFSPGAPATRLTYPPATDAD